MLAFRVEMNGGHSLVAGVEDWSLLSLHLTANRKEDGSTVRDGYIEVSVGGLSLPDAEGNRYHFRWPVVPLEVGSVVSIKVEEASSAEPPKKRYRSDAELQESPFTEAEMREMRYRDYLALKAEFERPNG
jgi:hypothetical protein